MVQVGLAMDKVAPGQVFHRAHQFSPVSTFPPTLHTHSFIHLLPALYNLSNWQCRYTRHL